MKIDSLHIDGFGLFHAAALEDLSPKLSVVLGSNESGKSTLLAFLRFLFFGFTKGKGNRYPPLRGGGHGGRLVALAGGGRYVVERLVERRPPLAFTLPEGSPGTEDSLRILLGGMRRETYYNTFAFSLQELQQLDKAFDQETLRHFLYDAGAGLKPETLRSAQESLESGLPRPSAVKADLARLEQLQTGLREIEAEAAGYEQLCGEIAALEERSRALEKEQRRLTQLEALRQARGRQQGALDTLLAEKKEHLGSRSLLRIDAALLGQAAGVRELLGARDQLAGFRREQPALERDLSLAESQAEACLAVLGPDWTPPGVESFPLPADLADQISRWSQTLKQAEIEAATARERASAAAEALEKARQEESQAAGAAMRLPEPGSPIDEAQMERLLGGRGDDEHTTSDLRARRVDLLNAEQDLQGLLREIDPAWTEEQLAGFDTSDRARAELEAARDRAAAETKAREQLWRSAHRGLVIGWGQMPQRQWPIWVALAAPVVGLAAAASLWSIWPPAALTVLVAAALAAAASYRLDSRDRAGRRALAASTAALCRQLGIEPAPGQEALTAIEKAIAAAIEALPQAPADLESFHRVQLAQLQQEKVAGLRHRIEAMERNRLEYLRQLNDVLRPRGESPAALEELPTRLSRVLESVRREREAGEQRRLARSAWEQAEQRRRLAEQASSDASARQAEGLETLRDRRLGLDEWLEAQGLRRGLAPDGAREFVENLRRTRDALARAQDLEARLRRRRETEQQISQRLEMVLSGCGRRSSGDPVVDLDVLRRDLAATEETSRQAAVLEARLEEIERQIGQAQQELDRTVGRLGELAGEHTNSEDLDLAAVEAQLGAAADELIDLKARQLKLGADDRLARLLEQQQNSLEQIRQAARRWAVLALARRMLADACRRYEQQRQPEVVRRASVHFRRLTGGRYQGLWIPLEGGVEALPVGEEAPKAVEQLSRGAAEQLYLALRFGFVEHLARRSPALPIIMDDILVNFDPGRARCAVQALVELAEQFQILFFTCHPETVQTFREVDPGIPLWEICDGRVAARSGFPAPAPPTARCSSP